MEPVDMVRAGRDYIKQRYAHDHNWLFDHEAGLLRCTFCGTRRSGCRAQLLGGGMSEPWWCRTFGHSFVTQRTEVVNETRWFQPLSVPTVTFCRRCGVTLPAPSTPARPVSSADGDPGRHNEGPQR